jgi:hypothetical protein
MATATKNTFQVIETKASTGRTVYAISHRLTKESLSALHPICRTAGLFLYAAFCEKFGKRVPHIGASKSFEGEFSAKFIKLLLNGCKFETETEQAGKPKKARKTGKVAESVATADIETETGFTAQQLATLKALFGK